eukprot:CAMPEP_0174732952 /NCGR_PEP_ID=MMETSP1094-20130205/60362_1 /TAXON_ID=156173 /ORGANISM="Chrysochromulina brevifilum, Strain UTEX LB 985" /LENGTH=197 /DNA_ID=CAMNT_0015935535 /DNA_START=36 /DNA_END=629 /DNA_ORIENTATION=-
MMRLCPLILLIAATLAGAAPVEQRLLQEQQAGTTAQPPAPAKKSWSLWSAAKSFFDSREKVKAKAAGSPEPKKGVLPAGYSSSYKVMVNWYCAKPEMKEKNLCKLATQGKVNDGSLKSDISKTNTTSDARDAFRLYCADKTRKLNFICLTSMIKKPPSSTGVAKTGLGTAEKMTGKTSGAKKLTPAKKPKPAPPAAA